MTGVAWWSQTAANNANQDSAINWQEGQSPSSVNDSARAMMASTAKWRDDITGSIVTAGTSTAYTVTSNQVFDNLTRLAGQMIAFTPHATNGATVTLNVDGLGAKPLRSSPGIDLPAGILAQGTPYIAVYNATDAAFYLRGFFGNPYIVPLGAIVEYAGASVPNSSFVFPAGQALNRTTYASLFSLIAVTFGAGDGSTTFNVPDLTGRVTAMKEAAPNRLTSSYFGGNSAAMGAAGGSESTALSTGNLPPYTPSGSVSTSVSSAVVSLQSASNGGQNAFATSSTVGGSANMSGALGLTLGSSFTGSAQGGSSAPFRTVQPTIILNKIMRVL
ncbi:tail fiber protein [Bradyrhizobium elkanii]|uniref:Microcystin-dependent protein n=1 Tax=Bradyrhizobium elkanii TaxID=29448 RepID=A0ABV4F0Q9_BRAEL|nr:tail fiber protein [Bradyrhizobium elkanii]MCP1758028.1 microcystin-dependent protein [Bradyrhizobium elkanii]MCP1983345.1 microcystin-dependent protein [Bradyrhizobium elkanii]MCS3881675.1 microcystin-dependent protein [Bradyrhizobium elkanii]MCS4218433.1 microcystin-dependent protein [Bradyrhizobium elkanii]MCW2194297.1 microcystin-dependent protein [Bradyrhizobium elkanii]